MVAASDVSMAFRQAGRLEQLRVRVGERVKKEQVLASLDVQEARQELKVAQAQSLAQQAEHRKAELRQRQARVELKRVEVLGAQVSGAELDDARLSEELASVEVSITSARMAEQSARVELLSIRLKNMELRAPFDGQVAALPVPVGGQVAEGQTVIRLLLQEERFRVRFAVPEPVARQLQPGARVEVRDPGAATGGWAFVDWVWPEVDIASRQVFIEASAPLSGGAGATLRVGMPVQLIIDKPGLERGPVKAPPVGLDVVAGNQAAEKAVQ
ncbi:efflux RND transporter periplasmic adaptor subunit [Corallococcus sp. c25j21]|nr:efflux RND transporter periplasmic adaptor subunit [Corallococcus silvisoli]